MTTEQKRKVKRFIIRWELAWYVVTGALYALALAMTWALFPNVSNLTLQLTLLFTGLTATIASAASAIKSSDTET
jgi:hypothetical protein